MVARKRNATSRKKTVTKANVRSSSKKTNSSTSKYDCICVGSATIDAFAYTDDSEIVRMKSISEEHTYISYESGAKILINDINFTVGGGGTNTATAMGRLGLNVAYLGHLGEDTNGDLVIQKLSKEKIDFIGTRGKETTNYSIILNSIERDRSILAFKEASDALSFRKINKTKLSTKWFYFSSLLGPGYKTLVSLTNYAKKHRIKVAFNPSNYQAKLGYKALSGVLKHTEYLILNKEEAFLLTGSPATFKEVVKKIRHSGAKNVIITDGRRGVYAISHHDVRHVKPLNAKIVETTGAGDAFASSFIAGLILKDDVNYALRLGSTNAESVITKPGAKEGLLSLSKANKVMKKKSRRIAHIDPNVVSNGE